MIRILRWIAHRIRGKQEEEDEEGECEFEYLTERELRVLAVRSLIGIDRSLRYLVKQNYDCEDCEDDEDSTIPYPENNRPKAMIV